MKAKKYVGSFRKASFAAVSICLTIALASCSNLTTSSIPSVQRVVVKEVGKNGLQKSNISAGRVMGDTESEVMSNISGEAIRVNAQMGSFVKAGQPLIVLDDREYKMKLEYSKAGLLAAQAKLAEMKNGSRSQYLQQLKEKIDASKASVDNAKQNVQRMQTLMQSGAVPQSEVDAAQLAYKQATAQYEQLLQEQSLAKEGSTKETLASLKANVEQMQALVNESYLNKTKTVITAPLSGRIADVKIHEGETVSPGVPLITIVSRQPIVEAYISEDQINHIQIGQTLPVKIEQISSKPFQAKVIAISPAMNSSSKEYPIKLSLPGDPNQWKSGMYAEVQLPDQKNTRLTVPANAVVKKGNDRFIMVMNGNKAKAKAVVTGASDGVNIEILEGLAAGDKVIIVGQDQVKDGDTVQVASEESSK